MAAVDKNKKRNVECLDVTPLLPHPDLTTPTIFWMPRGALMWQQTPKSEWEYRSAAVILIHEMQHARSFDLAEDKTAWRKNAISDTDKVWKNSEEKKAVEVENAVAQECNQHGAKEGIRKSYKWLKKTKHAGFISTGSTSIMEAKFFDILR